MSKKIIVTGGDGRFAYELKKINSNFNFIFRNKKQLNILSLSSIRKNLETFNPDYILHLAGLSRPMSIHEKDINKSINLNIIGTCNLVNEASKKKIKIVYLSTSYVYPGNKGNYKEDDSIKPWNNYSWSKLGGECAVQMYHNSLILRICMTEKPFVHKKAFNDVEMNFMYHEDLANNLLKLINKKGIINIGGPKQIVYNFAKKTNPNVKSVSAKKMLGKKFPLKQSMNIKKYLKIIKK